MMISVATLKVGKKTHKMKLSTRCLARLEIEHDGKPFDILLGQILTGEGGVNLVISFLAAGLNEGKGMERDEVFDLVDSAGGYRSFIPLISEAIGCAFPHIKDAIEADASAEDGTKGKSTPPAGA